MPPRAPRCRWRARRQIATRQFAHEFHAGLQCPALAIPGQRIEAKLAYARQHCLGGLRPGAGARVCSPE